MESAQIEEDGGMDKLLDFHLYFTAALQRTDMRAVGLQLAMDLIHRKVTLQQYNHGSLVTATQAKQHHHDVTLFAATKHTAAVGHKKEHS